MEAKNFFKIREQIRVIAIQIILCTTQKALFHLKIVDSDLQHHFQTILEYTDRKT